MTDNASDSSHNLLQNVMDEIPEGLQIISHDWRYLYVNKTVADQGKRRREELIGRTMMECYPGIENTPLFEKMKTVMEKKERMLFDNEFIFPDGSLGWFQLYINPWNDGILVLSIDVTDRKLKEIELAGAVKELSSRVESPDHTLDDLKKIVRKMLDLIPHVDQGKFHE